MKHAIYSPSASERWINCPASVALEKSPDCPPPKVYLEAAIGTQAHELIHRTLLQRIGKKIQPGSKTWQVDPSKIPSNYSQEMREHVAVYISWLGEKLAECSAWYPEYKVSLSDKVWGTSDIVGIKEKGILVIDFKYGERVPVSAYNNTQLGIYGIGALKQLKKEGHIEGYIYQPRITNADIASRWDFTPEAQATLLNEIALAITEAEGGFAIPRRGGWCTYCRALSICPSQKDLAQEIALTSSLEMKNPMTLTLEELAFVKRYDAVIRKFLDAVDYRILDLAKHGTKVPGIKVIAGRRNRKWADEEALMGREDFFGLKQEVILSPAQAEKKLGKDVFAENYSQFLAVLEPQPRVVLDTDKGEEFNFAESIASDFDNEQLRIENNG